MSNAEQVSQALAELWDIVKCRCHEAYTGRGLHDPDCECDSTDALQIVTDRIKQLVATIEALTKERDAARQDAKAAEDELEMQEQEACMMENDYIKLEKERDALEAKLAKTVEALRQIADPISLAQGNVNAEIALATLAEIKGESHD